MPRNNSRARRQERKEQAEARNAEAKAVMYTCGHVHGLRKGCKGARRKKTTKVAS